MQSAPLRPLLLACLAAACLPPGEAGPAVADPSGGTTEASDLPQGVVPADPAGPSAADPASPEGPHPADPADSADTGPVEVDTGDELPLDTGMLEEAPPGDLPPADLGPGFVDLTATVWDGTTFQVYPGGGPGTRDYPATTWVSVGDLDGDGVREVLASEVLREDWGIVQVFSAEPAGLVWRADLTERVGLHPGPVVTVVDLDGDGHDDLLRASDRATFGFGDGAGAWTDGALQRGPGLSRLPSLSLAALGDLDQDGWLDLVFGPGDCASSLGVLAAVRTGARTWETRTDLLEEERVVQPYALAVVPAPGGGQDLLALGRGCVFQDGPTNVWTPGAAGDDGRVHWSAVERVPSDAAFRLQPSGAGAKLSRRNPMGGALADLDRDGFLDLVLALADPWIHVLEGDGSEVYDAATFDHGIELGMGAAGEPELPWGLAPLDLDRDGRSDVVFALGDDARVNTTGTWNGPYTPHAWWTPAEGPSVDVTAAAGLGLSGNWRALTVHDVDGDAAPDLGLGGLGEAPRVLLNRVDTAHGHLALRLQGTTSNHLGIGAVVTVEVDGLDDQTFAVGAIASPGGISSPTVFVGLGLAHAARRATVRWPSGTVQVVEDLAEGRTHAVVEPPVLTLSEADRHLPADGLAELVVEVRPRHPDGGLRAVGDVTVELVLGEATWTGPVVREGDTWRRTLRAPAVAGEAVVRASVDGTPLPLAPRVWFDAADGP